MKIDCRNLECPQPVIKTKDALAGLKDGELLEILINATAPRENISRFLRSQNQNFDLKELGDGEILITATKSGNIAEINAADFACEVGAKKVVFLNEDRSGSGPVGEVLLSKFLAAFMQVQNKPYAVILVNNAVKMTCDRAHPSFAALKDLERIGVKILSCGSCLEAYKLVDKLAIGEITNAFEVVDLLSKYEEIKL